MDSEEYQEDFYECVCGHGSVAMGRYINDPEYTDISLCIWERIGNGGFDMRTRLRWIWRILRVGRPYEDDLILTKEDALKLGESLVEFANKRVTT
jgi:hypothetical protein